MGWFPLDRPARIAVLASGRGSNLSALLDAFPRDGELGRTVLVISNRNRADALQRAAECGVESVYVPYRDNETFEANARNWLDQARIDLICLAGFMRILSATFVDSYQDRILNIHPSLLPSFPGLYAQKQAIQARAYQTGCTVHIVDAGVDTGSQLLQRTVPVYSGDTEESLAARILVEEHIAYPEAVRRLLRGEFDDIIPGHS